MPTSVETKFLVISDTHNLQLEADPRHAFRAPSPKADVLLHCGDLTENGGYEQHQEAINMLHNIDAELKLVIPGNHEVDLDETFYTSQGGSLGDCLKVKQLWAAQRSEGILLLSEGLHQLTLHNGATFTIYASPWTPKHGVSAFQYDASEDRYNHDGHSHPSSWTISTATSKTAIPTFPELDIIMTHGPPCYILDESENGLNVGCEHLRRALARARPRLHCFGHVHNSWGAARIVYCEPHSFRSSDEDRVKEGAFDSHDDQIDDLDSLGGAQNEDGIIQLPPVFIGKNQSRKRGYASISVEDVGSNRSRETLLINAAVINDDGKPRNPPWLVKMHLPIADMS